MPPEILVEDSVTKLGERHRGSVLIAGSHGGAYAGSLAAAAGLRGVILNDAGVGRDAAGIASLGLLDGLGLAAATVGHDTARIGDGADMAARGRISHVNRVAAALGCRSGQAAMDCAEAMLKAAPFAGAVPAHAESRFLLRQEPGRPPVWGCDSASLIRAGDEEAVIVCGSHGGLLRNSGGYVIKVPVRAILFHDAGVGVDGAGISRLEPCGAMGVPAAAVAADSARIGDARSIWETGIVSHVNRLAASLGAKPGAGVPDYVACVTTVRGRSA